jgi:hypothetical protein
MLRAALLAGGAMLGAAALAEEAVLSARYGEPVARYGHDVLGDTPEWGALELLVETCTRCADLRSETRIFRLPETAVFEDISPILADLDGDGAPEVIVVESDLALGARLAIFGPEGRITATPHIGTRFRWLAPLGAADLDGDGGVEIAYVDRPHLAQVLRILRFRDGRLENVAELAGVTNHRIGDAFIQGGIRDCGTGPEVIAASGDWSRVIAVRLTDAGLKPRDLGPYSPASLSAALDCAG